MLPFWARVGLRPARCDPVGLRPVARLIAARVSLCAGAGWAVFCSPALAARCRTSLRLDADAWRAACRRRSLMLVEELAYER